MYVTSQWTASMRVASTFAAIVAAGLMAMTANAAVIVPKGEFTTLSPPGALPYYFRVRATAEGGGQCESKVCEP